MRVTQLHRLATLALVLLTSQLYAGPFNINGKVLSDAGQPLPGIKVEINDLQVKTDRTGGFSITVPSAELYSIRFSADGYFSMLHEFSALGLAGAGDEHSSEIPDVTLVQRKAGRVMFAIGGDTMAGRRYSRPLPGEPVLIRPGHEKEDTASLLRFVAPYLKLADYTSVNLEIQVMETAPDTHAPKSVVFFTPPSTLDSLVGAGVSHVTLGNNHIYDYLDEGLDATLNALDASPLDWSGAGRTEQESLKAHREQLGNDSYSFLGFVGWAGNFWPNQVAEGNEKGGAAYGSQQNILQSVKREVAAGQLPIVHYHGSREYTDEPTLTTETRLKAAIDEGAVLAIGHHPHMVQGFEIYRDKLIAYSMGNFMFDQYMSATQRSFLLYVWMDGDKFHRAEIVPLHIKGYVPMPATDTVRQAVLRRTAALSGRRNVTVSPSGGHGVITPRHGKTTPPTRRAISPPETGDGASVWAIGPEWHRAIDTVLPAKQQDTTILLGMDLLPTGHLESHYLNDAPDRTWLQAEGLSIISDTTAPSGHQVMQLLIPAGQSKGRFGARTFDLTFIPGTPTSFVVKARADAPARVVAHQQWRRRGQNRSEALELAELMPIGEKQLEPGGWRELRFDFDSPRVSAYAYRIVVEVEPMNTDRDFEARFDDINLVEWLGPPLSTGRVPSHVETMQASHIGLD